MNFGAGTTNSNLLNTYGEVIATLEPGGERHRTGRCYMGAIVGDHAKFAICTRIMTGAVVGVGAMYAATAPCAGAIAPLAWITDAGERSYRTGKFVDVARTVMARRDQRMGTACEAALHRLASGT